MRLLFKLNIVKQYFRLILAAIGTSISLVSCSDEFFSGENGIAQPEGSRVIAISFGTQTRTALGDDGLTPEFVGGEMILVSNDETTQECQVTFSGEKAIITTSLKGTLTAVYPATAAQIENNVIAGVKVSTEQSGKIADANICMAKNITDAATFVNQTAILKFYVGEEIGVTSINVTSSGEEIADGSKTITVAASGGKTLYDNMPTGQDRRICYVAVKSGANANTLTFTTKTNTQGQQTKTATVDATLAIGMMYNAFIPYYVEVGDQKWAYCNIGAFLPEEPGEYFAWGEVKGHKADFSISPDNDGNIPEAFASDFKVFNHSDARYTGTYNSSSGFAFCNTPYYNGTSFDKYTGSDGNTLLREDDAANANWGNNWRMPTSQDFYNLYDACAINGYGITTYAGTERGEVPTFGKGVYWCGNYDGVAGCLFCDGTNKLFFPAMGCGSGTKLIDVGKYVRYWSSTEASYDHYAYRLDISDSDVDLQLYGNRFDGNSVRPIYDYTIPDGALPGVFSVGPNEEDKVHFSKGNLYCDNSNSSAPIWGFEEKQYYFRTISGKGKCDASGYSINTGTLTNHWGLFGWSSENDDNYGMNLSDDYKDYSGEFKDWGENIGGGNIWRTMSIDEWIYLLETRNASTINGVSNARYMFCRIKIDDSNSVPGMLVFSDDFSWPTGTAPVESAATTINGNYGSYTEYEIAEFESLESAGAVFLPEAGQRKSGTEIMEVDIYGGYRSSTAIDEQYARYLSFYYTTVDMNWMTDSRHFGDLSDWSRMSNKHNGIV